MRANSFRRIQSPTVAQFLIASTLLLAAVAFEPAIARAQLPQARLNTVYPVAGRGGTTVDLWLGGGVDLDEASELYFSHPGISAVQKKAGEPPQPVAGQFVVTIAADVPVGVYDVRVRGLYGL